MILGTSQREGHDFSRAASTRKHRGFSRWGKLETDELTLSPGTVTRYSASLDNVLRRTKNSRCRRQLVPIFKPRVTLGALAFTSRF
jgi:hypothetical protein